MQVAHYTSALAYRAASRRRTVALWLSASVLAAVVSLVVFADRASLVLLAMLVPAAALPLLSPRYGVYAFFAATLLLEQVDPPGGPGLITAETHFFSNINTFTSLPVSATPAELMLGLIVLGWMVRSRKRAWSWWTAAVDSGHHEDIRIGQQAALQAPSRNALFWPVLFFGLTLIVGTVHGLATGGDFKAALWEIRAPFYMLILILLLPHLIEDRRHVTTLIWITVAGGILKSLEGLWISLVVLHGGSGGFDTIVGHDDAVFLAADLVLLAAMLLIGADRHQRLVLGLFSPAILYVLMVTNRRAAFVALGIGLLIVAVARSREKPDFAVRLVCALMLVAGIYGMLLAIAPDNRALNQPVRAFTSAYSPSSERDELSNVYRAYERTGLWRTIKANPLVGIGFGKKYDVPLDVFDIGFPLYEYIPHNDVLRMWAKSGSIGFILHLVFFGTAIVQGTVVYRRLRDRTLKAMAIFAVAFTAMQLTVQYVDMLMTFYRNMIILGLLVGLFLTFERLDSREAVQ